MSVTQAVVHSLGIKPVLIKGSVSLLYKGVQLSVVQILSLGMDANPVSIFTHFPVSHCGCPRVAVPFGFLSILSYSSEHIVVGF